MKTASDSNSLSIDSVLPRPLVLFTWALAVTGVVSFNSIIFFISGRYDVYFGPLDEILRSISILLCFVLGAIAYRKNAKTWAFTWSFLPIHLFFVMMSIRLAYAAWTGEMVRPSGNYIRDALFGLGRIAHLWSALVFFSFRLSESAKKSLFWWILSPLLVVVVLMIEPYSRPLLRGITARDAHLIPYSLKFQQVLMAALSATVPATVLLFFGVVKKRVSVVCFIPLYLVSIALMYVGASRISPIALAATHFVLFVVFLLSPARKTLRFWALLFFVLIANAGLVSIVGYKSPHAVAKRLHRTLVNVNEATEEATEKIVKDEAGQFKKVPDAIKPKTEVQLLSTDTEARTKESLVISQDAPCKEAILTETKPPRVWEQYYHQLTFSVCSKE